MPHRGHYLQQIEKAKAANSEGAIFSYTDRDVILYNISLGATSKDLPLVFEKNPDFHVLPSYGVIVAYSARKPFDLANIIPNFSYKMLLHGEQYLEVHKWPIPTAATVLSKQRLVDVIDKTNAAIVVTATTSCDADTGDELFYSETTLFIRGSGGFGGPRSSSEKRGRATETYKMPSRDPDMVAEERTSPDQAALYRLNGDSNPLHIDPEVATAAGFKDGPILHGLCSFGLAVKHILANYGKFNNIKVRFAGIVLPGQTLKISMWSEGRTVVFQAHVKETGKLCIDGGGIELPSPNSQL